MKWAIKAVYWITYWIGSEIKIQYLNFSLQTKLKAIKKIIEYNINGDFEDKIVTVPPFKPLQSKALVI